MKSTASATWYGNLFEGSGTVSSGSGHFSELPVSWAARTESPEGKTTPEDSKSPLESPSQDARPWGNLPAKLHEDAQKARQKDPPERWREHIERFREGVNNE